MRALLVIAFALIGLSSVPASAQMMSSDPMMALPTPSMGDMPNALNENDEQRDIYNRGIGCFRRQEYDCAISVLTQYLRLQPLDSNAFLARGASYAAKNDNARAIADFDRVVKLKPATPNVYLLRGVAHMQNFEVEAALGDFNEAVKANPKDANALTNRGTALIRAQKYDDAITDFDRAIELSPKNAPAYMNRARAKQAKGDAAGAGADVAKAKAIDPGIK